ncbi:hypothetical protein D7V94_19755 [Parablautia intestinalis]|uniref:Uncharacterized protein n=2 Tax=Parablautia intestinalis TaxID=2320100 RepID=A0A3A9APF4_9FIRM|nr:hypothetical protein [Lachnospiraceae bacterium]MDE7046899.1 hypothetical protein [Lachnospiraceae bacterium]RKI88215.1 hypothetical protein D7V94_19755 [Parablautia intestinalis]
MRMSKEKGQGRVKALIIVIFLLCLVLGYYYYLSNKRSGRESEQQVKATAVQEVLMRDLESNYPPTPREVVKYYAEITRCFYGEDYTDEEFKDMAMKIQKLYDDELVANKTEQQYLDDLLLEINGLKDQQVVISSYSPASSTDVEEFVQDGYSWAQMRCTFNLRQGTQFQKTEEIFLLRKDADGHWKIFGWTLAEEPGDA